ncbi:MAG: DUF61 family protein [Candidatus Thorarchaeota archaeon]|nr:DUF61 family protein [Candidatus Thorarchaeota archaeon]
MSDHIERMLEREIDSVNDHLPKKAVPLRDLMRMSRPTYETRGGETSFLVRKELEYVASEVPERYHGDVMIPVVILRRMDLGQGIYTVAGTKPTLFLIHRILGDADGDWDRLGSWEAVDRLARPQVQLVRRRLPSTTCIGFTTQC